MPASCVRGWECFLFLEIGYKTQGRCVRIVVKDLLLRAIASITVSCFRVVYEIILRVFFKNKMVTANSLRQLMRFMVRCDRSLYILLPMLEFVREEDNVHNQKLFEDIIKFASNSLLACLYYAGFFDDDPHSLSFVCGVASLRYQEHEDERDLISRMIRENTGKCE